MTSYALLFPGQGAQYVGMGAGLFSTTKGALLVEQAEDVLKLSLKKLMLDGPAEELMKTVIAQPVILLHSLAAFYFLKDEMEFSISCALGHSLGEYSACVATGVFSFEDALKIVHARGKYMQEAVPEGHGAMAAVIGMEPSLISSLLEEFADSQREDYVSCANFNGPLQTVIAGTRLGVSKAAEKLKAMGAKRIIDLVVSAPFHCALMKPVQQKMRDLFTRVVFSDAKYPIISNVTAEPETKSERIRELLIEQIVSPVKFTECISYAIAHDFVGEGFLELGPKNILSGIVKKIDQSLITRNVEVPDDIKELHIKRN